MGPSSRLETFPVVHVVLNYKHHLIKLREDGMLPSSAFEKGSFFATPPSPVLMLFSEIIDRLFSVWLLFWPKKLLRQLYMPAGAVKAYNMFFWVILMRFASGFKPEDDDDPVNLRPREMLLRIIFVN